MILEEQEEVKGPKKQILLAILGAVLLFAGFRLLKSDSEPQILGEQQEKEILSESIEPFWRPIKDVINELNIEAETQIAVNRLEPGEVISSELFRKEGNQLLSKIDGPEEQVITWKGTTDDQLAYNLIGRVYLSGHAPIEGESFAYATLEVLAPDNSLKMERVYPIDDSAEIKKERIKKIEAGASLPPPDIIPSTKN
jgi:hypothetical protein